MKLTADYGATGLTLAQAMLELVKRFADKGARPDHILWNGLSVKTADCFSAPERGIVKIDILSRKNDLEQGVDIKVEDGALRLRGAKKSPRYGPGQMTAMKTLLSIHTTPGQVDCGSGTYTK